MSSIFFHSPSGDARLSGAERHYAANIVNNIAFVPLESLSMTGRGTLRCILPPDCYASDEGDLIRYGYLLRLWFNSGLGHSVFVLPDDGREVSVWECQLNTALMIGPDPVRLLARLHGQCEIHAWVDGPDRAWLADIIDQGLRTRILREYVRDNYVSGWTKLSQFLRQSDCEPVVTSYSVMSPFPNPDVAGFIPDDLEADDAYEAWDNLPLEEQWAQCMAVLQDPQSGWGNQMSPGAFWEDFRFGQGYTTFDLRDIALNHSA